MKAKDIKAARGLKLSCKGWHQEAALRMLNNNLDAEVAEDPENLIVYSSLRDGVYQLFTLNPFKNEDPRQLTSDLSHHEAPSWSPDGNQVIFAKRDGKKNHIYGILKNGTYQRRLFILPGSQTYPQWAR